MNIVRLTPAHRGAGPRACRPRQACGTTLPHLAAILGLAALACKGKDDPAARRTATAAGDAVPPSVIAPSSTPYREVAVANPGVIRVLVGLDGDVSRDSVMPVPAEQQAVCGGSTIAVGDVTGQGDRLADAVVWLADVREGKALPVERRYELAIERCRFVPHVQVAVAGGTLNLRGMDDAAHRTRFVRHGDGARLSEISTTEPLSVVPDEKVLKSPGQVEVTCALHPWARAWLMTFDHPYAAVTAADGAARLDGVPPGRWRIVVWHERFGVREDFVEVKAGQETSYEVKLKAR